jgi:hypothetical protein
MSEQAKEHQMNGYYPSLTAALAGERRSDLLRDAARSRMIADLPARDRHETPRHRVAWWARATSFVSHRVSLSRA